MAAKTQVNTTSPTLDILQPEVMSREELIAALEQKKVDQCDIGSLEKERLIELYYKSVLPMPQRKYRLNRRGQFATKQQVVMGKSRKRTFEKIHIADSTTDSSSQSRGLITSFRLPPSSSPPVDRLKPPPVNTERKIIRLNSKSSDSGMSGIVIKDRTAVKSPNGSSAGKGSSDTGSVTKSSTGSSTDKVKTFKVNRVSFSSEPTTTSTKEQKSPPARMDISPEVKTKQQKLPSSKSSPDTSDEEVVRKKFKTASITWP